jgi:ATP-binding cassette subfamily B multidrug efflux pump
MLGWFERRVDPFPEKLPRTLPGTFFAFMWACSTGVRPYILWMTLLTAVIGAFEALLFSMLGRLIDWLGASGPERFFVEQRTHLAWLAAILVASPVVIALQAWLKYQAIAPSFPMRLRWIFHRRMLD